MWGFRYQAKQVLLHKLDADNYSQEDVIVLAVPVTLPYPIQQSDYERVNGEFEYQGEYYHLVKQKYDQDTLYMVCIKDAHQKKISSAFKDFTKLTNNLPARSKQALNYLGKLFKEFQSNDIDTILTSVGWSYKLATRQYHAVIPDRVIAVISPPPEIFQS